MVGSMQRRRHYKVWSIEKGTETWMKKWRHGKKVEVWRKQCMHCERNRSMHGELDAGIDKRDTGL